MPKEQVHRRCQDCNKVFTTRQGLFKHKKNQRCSSARTTVSTVCSATSGKGLIPRVSKLAQQLESARPTVCKSSQSASQVKDCLISEGVGSPNKEADFVFVDLSKDSPVTEEYIFRPESVVSEVISLGDELQLEFPDLIQADNRVSREQQLDPDQFVSGLELNCSSVGIPIDTSTAVTSNSCDTNNTTPMASSNNKEDSTLFEQVSPASTVTQLSLEDEVTALEGALQGAMNTINVVAARLNVLKQQVAGAITTTPKPCASMGTVIFEGMQNPAVTMRDGTLMVSSETGTVRIQNKN